MHDDIGLDDLESGSLTLRLRTTDAMLRVYWLGRANHRRPAEVLNPYFDKLITTATQNRRELEFRFEQLEHFNSSTILVLLHLIQTLRSRKLRLTLVYDGDLKWQKMTFEALRKLAKFNDSFELRELASPKV